MTKIVAIAMHFPVLVASMGRAGEVILPYSAFGPQAAAYELIGMEWWQWESHGDGPGREYPIKVVVFWDQSEAEAAKSYPVNQEELQDFRYVEYSKAVGHMASLIKNFKEWKLDATPTEGALADLQKAYNAERTSQGLRNILTMPDVAWASCPCAGLPRTEAVGATTASQRGVWREPASERTSQGLPRHAAMHGQDAHATF